MAQVTLPMLRLPSRLLHRIKTSLVVGTIHPFSGLWICHTDS